MNYLTIGTIFKKDSLLFLLKIFLPTTAFLALVFAIGKMNDISFGYFSRDAIQTLWHEPNAEVEFYIGFLSNFGIIFWCFTVAILFISSKIAKDLARPRALYLFLFFSGLLTLFMLVDDLFLLHDVIIPYYLEISEKFFYLFYGSSVLALLYFFREVILKTDYLLFLLAFAFMASSVITDILLTLGINISDIYLFEDGFKFMGIISWFVYFTRTSYIYIRPEKKINRLVAIEN
jgi:hypothetical protein